MNSIYKIIKKIINQSPNTLFNDILVLIIYHQIDKAISSWISSPNKNFSIIESKENNEQTLKPIKDFYKTKFPKLIENFIRETKRSFPKSFEMKIEVNFFIWISYVFTSTHLFESFFLIKEIFINRIKIKLQNSKFKNCIFFCSFENVEFIIDEFFEHFWEKGANNLRNHLEKTIKNILQKEKFDIEEFSLKNNTKKFFTLLKIVEKEILKVGSSLKKPENYKDSYLNMKNLSILLRNKEFLINDFNIINNSKNEENLTLNSIFTNINLSIPSNKIDYLYMFIGDIDNHKYLIDNEVIEKYLINSNKFSFAEKYKSSMNLDQISEEEKSDNESSISIKAEIHQDKIKEYEEITKFI